MPLIPISEKACHLTLNHFLRHISTHSYNFILKLMYPAIDMFLLYTYFIPHTDTDLASSFKTQKQKIFHLVCCVPNKLNQKDIDCANRALCLMFNVCV